MDGSIICKTMIYAYKDLERKCKEVDDYLLRVGKASFNGDILETFDKMASVMVEKKAYCNVKFLIDEALKEMKHSEELECYHLLGMETKEIASKFNVSEKAISKRTQRQREDLANTILAKYECLRLWEIIRASRWLTNKYREFMAEKLKG